MRKSVSGLTQSAFSSSNIYHCRVFPPLPFLRLSLEMLGGVHYPVVDLENGVAQGPICVSIQAPSFSLTTLAGLVCGRGGIKFVYVVQISGMKLG